MMNRICVVISRDVSGDSVRRSFEDALAEKCRVSGHFDVMVVPHIYQLSEDSSVWVTLAAVPNKPVVLSWLHPRPAAALLRKHGCVADSSHVFNMSAYLNADDCYEAIQALRAPTSHYDVDDGSFREITEEITDRWYPVMDSTRCTNCGNCLQFCIFNVFEYDADHRVVASNPGNCKPGCPACSRVCPQSAISFPLYSKDEAIAGAPGLFVTMSNTPRKPQTNIGGTVCSLCGQKPNLLLLTKIDPSAVLCKECGRPTLPELKAASRPPQDALDDLDSLVDDLENLARKRI